MKGGGILFFAMAVGEPAFDNTAAFSGRLPNDMCVSISILISALF
jgi:hypothetical protein